MAISTLQAESVATTAGIDPALLETAGAMMGLPPSHPKVVDRVSREESERSAVEYARNAICAATSALAALDAIDRACIFDNCGTDDEAQIEVGFALLRLARRELRAAVGVNSNPTGYDRFLDLLSVHGFALYRD